MVATILQESFPGQLNTPTPRVIMDLVKTKVGVCISYSTARRRNALAITNLHGTPEESYKKLYSYLYMLQKWNAGTFTSVKADNNGKFKYLFIALGASIQGFKAMRKVIIMDAIFLKNGYGGVRAQDLNRHIYPLVYSVLDGENAANWTWFFQMLKRFIPDSKDLVFMSDRNASLISAIGNVYREAYHGYCIWHMSQNVKEHAPNSNKCVVAWKFMEMSKQYIVADFNRHYELFALRFPSVTKYLEENIVKEKWARCYFSGERYNIDTSNNVKSMNSVFNEARKYSLIPMLDTIFKTIARWFNDRRLETGNGTDTNKLVSFVENLLHVSWGVAERLIVQSLYTFEFEVVGSDGNTYFMNLESRSYSCIMSEIEKYPCIHALAAYIHFHKPEVICCEKIQLHELCSKYYGSELWFLAYSSTVFLVPSMFVWDIPDEISNMEILPPYRVIKKGKNENEKVFIRWGDSS